MSVWTDRLMLSTHTSSISLPQTGWLMILFLERCRIQPNSCPPLKNDSQSLLTCFSSSFHPWHKSPGLFSEGRNMVATTGCLGVYCLTLLSSFWLCQMVQQAAFAGVLFFSPFSDLWNTTGIQSSYTR